MGCFLLVVSWSVTRLFIQKGLPHLPPPSGCSCTQPIRPARMPVRRDRRYLPAIPSQQSNKEKKYRTSLGTYECCYWLGMPNNHRSLVLEPIEKAASVARTWPHYFRRASGKRRNETFVHHVKPALTYRCLGETDQNAMYTNIISTCSKRPMNTVSPAIIEFNNIAMHHKCADSAILKWPVTSLPIEKKPAPSKTLIMLVLGTLARRNLTEPRLEQEP
ncbi:hypothetical protein HD554DRAFT_2081606 [Boletus coccyginus]|nr:hypothetical protein HD554DRAFT_2081606 [Boletus coccyginus]